MEAVPDGFLKHDRKSGLTDPWEPIYSLKTAEGVVLAVRAGPAHVNSRGFVHGGLLTALADNAMGLSCASQLPDLASLVTVSLSIDFLASAQTGQWISFEPRFVKVGGTICFTDCFVNADGVACAKASATFRALRKPS